MMRSFLVIIQQLDRHLIAESNIVAIQSLGGLDGEVVIAQRVKILPPLTKPRVIPQGNLRRSTDWESSDKRRWKAVHSSGCPF
jgi:hypothetical protein